jgi:hypothetical protein
MAKYARLITRLGFGYIGRLIGQATYLIHLLSVIGK